MDFYIYAKQVTHGRKDNAVRAHFLRPERGGLTTDLDKAGIYTEEEANHIANEAYIPVPMLTAQGLAHLVVNWEGLETTLAGAKKA
ncbi:MAG: hypothetical protein IID28_11490 [Planctomycetes bacterium]|nr:hypothetical protein [Planctomycetota bacterium]